MKSVQHKQGTTKAAQGQRVLNAKNGSNRAEILSGFYGSLNDLFNANISEAEEILYAVHRGQVAQVVSVTNIGKSTLMLNLCLALAAGQEYPPLVEHPGDPRRVLYIDFEATPAEFRDDMEVMLENVRNQELARINFLPVVGATINKKPLRLSVTGQMNTVIRYAKQHRADLIVVDPYSFAFTVNDENNNAEITRKVMLPLKRLASKTNAAVIFTHHIGKMYEGQSQPEGAYSGRGASAFGALARTMFNLKSVPSLGDDFVKLWCSKSKRGNPFRPVTLQLSNRWFRISGQEVPTDDRLTARDIGEYVTSREPDEVRTAEILKQFAPVSNETIKRRLREAVEHGLVRRVSQGKYRGADSALVTAASG
jgi:hypothetical protein